MPNRPWYSQKPINALNRPNPAGVNHDLLPRMRRKASWGPIAGEASNLSAAASDGR
jgi:hypothetical protein